MIPDERQPEHGGRDAPRQRLTRRRTEARRAEGDATDYCSGAQPDEGAHDRDEDRFGPREAHDAFGCRAADAKKRLLSAASFPPRRRDHACEQRRDDHARQPEEQEQHLCVDRVGPGAIQLRGEVVPDEAPAREGRFEVLRPPDHLAERRAGVGREVVGELHVDLRGGRARSGVGEHAVPGRVGQEHDVVRWGGGRRAGRDTDRLEEGVGGREIHDAVDRYRGLRLTGSSDRDRGTDRSTQVCGRLLREQRPGPRPDERADLAGERGRIVRRQPEDHSGSRRLDRAVAARGEA